MMGISYKYVLLLGVFVSFSFLLENKIKDLDENNKELYSYFEKEHLIDVSKNVNLSEVISIHDEKKGKIEKLYGLDNLDNNSIDKVINDKKVYNEKLSSDIVEASKRIDALDNDINSLSLQYKVVKKKYDSYVSGLSVSDGSSFLLSNVPTINQYPNYNTGCESVALTIMLRYYGVNVSPNDVIDNLKKSDLPKVENGVMYGGNPEVEFVGNPYGAGYGVFQNPIADVANKYKSGIHVETNFPLSKVLDLVKKGHPVQVWSSMYLALPYVSANWIYKPTGEKIYWHANEHAVIVVGYNDNNIIISDPIGGTIKYQSRSVFENRYNYFGKRALYYL